MLRFVCSLFSTLPTVLIAFSRVAFAPSPCFSPLSPLSSFLYAFLPELDYPLPPCLTTSLSPSLSLSLLWIVSLSSFLSPSLHPSYLTLPYLTLPYRVPRDTPPKILSFAFTQTVTLSQSPHLIFVVSFSCFHARSDLPSSISSFLDPRISPSRFLFNFVSRLMNQ